MENKQYTIEEHDITILSDDEPKNKKCSKCSKAKQTVTWLGLISIAVLGLSIYGLVELVKNVIDLFTK
jgi:hypothetical protein